MITQTLQSPPVYSSAYNPIIWMVASNATQNYNFKYIFDVYIGGATGPIRFKTPANPVGRGIIDINSLIQNEIVITENLPMLSNTPFYGGTGLAGEVYILAGEEYSITLNGDVIQYNGLGGTGEPAYGLYADANFRPCPNATTPVVALAWGQGANAYYDYLATGGETSLEYAMTLSTDPDAGGKWLTRYPGLSQEIRSDENFTISWLNYNFEAATGPASVPYAMKVTLYKDGVFTGQEIYYNTLANGGEWTNCSTWPGGPTGSQRYINSFKINPQDISTPVGVTRHKEELFEGKWGCEYQPLPDIFNGYHDVGLTPPYDYELNIFDDSFLTSYSLGIGGWSSLGYRDMAVQSGSTINIQYPSPDAWGSTWSALWLCGSTGTSSDPATWENIVQFTISENPVGFTYYSVNDYVTTKAYTALGLRTFAASSSQADSLYGCPIETWDITSPGGTADFDQFCLALYPYSDYTTCTIGATADSETMCLTINDTNCWGFEPIRFTWLNNLGGRDWYTFIKRNTFTQQAGRANFYKLPGYWSAATYNVNDNQPARYGTTTFRMDLTNSWTASTNWLSEEESNWLRSMFASPHVIAYLPGRTQPTLINITDANYSVQNFAREKLFQYFVSFTEAQPDVVQGF
jgi:hypothetical protein